MQNGGFYGKEISEKRVKDRLMGEYEQSTSYACMK
jgi:hypothetical protein